MTSVLILPGLTNSGPEHWQTLWEKQFNLKRVNQDNWNSPICDDWVERLEQSIRQADDKVVLVSHSLACILVVKWAEKYPRSIGGALLVAPSDTESVNYPPEAKGFSPIPLKKLPFASIVVASSNDPYVTLKRAQQFAQAWGSNFVSIGEKGHINSASHLGIQNDGVTSTYLDKIFSKEQGVISRKCGGKINTKKDPYCVPPKS